MAARRRKERGPAFLPVLTASLLLALGVPRASATPEFAERTGQGCGICHLDPEGGELSRTGLEFAASGYAWPPTGGYRVLGPARKAVRFTVGLLHLVAGFMWFGTILYVHILLRPAYASRGLPRGEVFVGLLSMITVGVTGALLTASRIRSLDVLLASPWGLLLTVKIALYLVMVSSALVVILFVGPRLRAGRVSARLPADGVFDPLTLSAFDGSEGNPAFAAYEGKVYDLSSSRLWAGGKHMRHAAGADLSAALPKAPHGAEKLEAFPVAGAYDAARVPPKTPAQKAFYVIAYLNLSLVFAVLAVIAFWRWGI